MCSISSNLKPLDIRNNLKHVEFRMNTNNASTAAATGAIRTKVEHFRRIPKPRLCSEDSIATVYNAQAETTKAKTSPSQRCLVIICQCIDMKRKEGVPGFTTRLQKSGQICIQTQMLTHECNTTNTVITW